MALIVSAATGNFNAGATWVGGVVPTIGDEARASTGHTISITANASCSEISNAGTGGYILNSGVTLTANVTNKSTTPNINCLSFSAASPATATIVGNVTGGVASNGSPLAGSGAILNGSTGTLFVQGNIVGGSNTQSMGAYNNSTGAISINGNVTGGTGSNSFGTYNASTGAISISGNVAGGSGTISTGAMNTAAGTYSITGNVSGGSVSNALGVNNSSTGVVTITSTTISGTVAIAVANAGGGTVNVTGNVTGGSSAVGISNAGVGTINVTGNITGGSAVSTSHGLSNASTGICAVTGICIGGAAGASGVINASTGTVRATRSVGNAYGPSNSAGLVSAVGISNVALGICEIEQLEFGTYGQSPMSGTGIRLKKANSNVAVFNFCDTAGAKTLIDATQNAAMPAATDVRTGVSYASGALTGTCAVPAASSVGFGVPVDATTGTAALTPAAVWGYATRSITGGTVDTLTNAPSVPSAATIASQVRTELTTELGRIDAAVSSRLAPSGTLATVTTLTNAPSVPSASTIASQVRTELTTELARIDAPISGATAPAAATVATAVRTELGTELGRIDAAITTRAATGTLATDVTAIKAKTDALVTDRLAQCSTVATTGAQLAAALS